MCCWCEVLLVRSADVDVRYRAAEQQSMHVYGAGAHDRKYPGGMPPGMPPGSGPYSGYPIKLFARPMRLLLFVLYAPCLRVSIYMAPVADDGTRLDSFSFCTHPNIFQDVRAHVSWWG